jgi:hypothetical protein
VRIGGLVFQIRHRAPTELAAASRTSVMVFQALRYLGQSAVDEQVIARAHRAIVAHRSGLPAPQLLGQAAD